MFREALGMQKEEEEEEEENKNDDKKETTFQSLTEKRETTYASGVHVVVEGL